MKSLTVTWPACFVLKVFFFFPPHTEKRITTCLWMTWRRTVKSGPSPNLVVLFWRPSSVIQRSWIISTTWVLTSPRPSRYGRVPSASSRWSGCVVAVAACEVVCVLVFFILMYSLVPGLAHVDEWQGPDRHRSDGDGENAGVPAAGIHPHGRSSSVSAGAARAVFPTKTVMVRVYRFSVDPNLSGTAQACWFWPPPGN